MRILRISQHLYPDVTGGMPYHVHAMSRDQAAMGHDVTVVTVSGDASLPRHEERDGYRIIRARPTFELIGNAFAKGVWDELRAVGEYDVVHAHAHYYFSTLFAALRRHVNDTPLAITNHGLYSQRAPERLFRWYLRTLGRWTINQADLVFCYSETDRNRVRELGVSSPIKIVPNGIDTDLFTPEGPESKLIESEGPVVLFVGRLVEGKRPVIALEAFAEVLKEYPDAELYLCGDGPLRENLKRRVRELGIDESVTFLGQMPYDEMPKVYRSGDVLVLPSRAEGVPRTVFEALSSGLQVVCSELAQVRSAFGKAVMYVGEGDTFGEGLVDALQNPIDRSELDEQFHWEQTVDATTAAIAQLTAGKE